MQSAQIDVFGAAVVFWDAPFSFCKYNKATLSEITFRLSFYNTNILNG